PAPSTTPVFPYTTLFRSLAARARPDGQDAQLVVAAAADPGVLAGAAEQLVRAVQVDRHQAGLRVEVLGARAVGVLDEDRAVGERDRKSTRLNSSHQIISY